MDVLSLIEKETFIEDVCKPRSLFYLILGSYFYELIFSN